jgi:hypothetical protein
MPRDPDVKADWRTLESSWSELEPHGHLCAARQARELLALFVQSYLLMQDHWLTFEDDKIDLDPVAY